MWSLKLARSLLLILAVSWMAAMPQTSHAAERWGCQEVVLKGAAAGNAYLETRLSAGFTQGAKSIEVSGFWDGGDVFKIRFMPPAPGPWHYETRSNMPELSGKSGSFNVSPPPGSNHGPVVVHKKFYLRYADGTPYHQFGTTCYSWTHQPGQLQEQTLRTLAASPFNKIRFCIFPLSFRYTMNEPELFPYKRRADGSFDFDRPVPAFWRQFERRILDLQKLGIEADLILWHSYDRWGFAQMSDAQDDRYLRYCIARLSAFRNVWWSLANEYDLMAPNPKSHRGNKTLEDWDRFFSILEKEDPFQHLRGIHNGRVLYDHTKAWVTHASLQSSAMNAGVRFRKQFQKPVIYDECRYEGDVPWGMWGRLSAIEMTQRFWLGTLSGCYVGHGETYLNPEEVLWWTKGGTLHGESPRRIQWLKDFMTRAPAFDTLQPLGDGKDRFILAGPDGYRLLYFVTQQSQSIHLPGEVPFKVDAIDPWEMKEWPAGTAPAGEFTVTPPKPNLAYRFTPQPAVK